MIWTVGEYRILMGVAEIRIQIQKVDPSRIDSRRIQITYLDPSSKQDSRFRIEQFGFSSKEGFYNLRQIRIQRVQILLKNRIID